MSLKSTKIENKGDVKTEIKSERLTSFFSPRDLTLGGSMRSQRTQVNKKVYAPNLNATRNKNTNNLKLDNDKEKDRASKNNRTKNNTRNNKNNSKRESNLIQTLGVFSEGTGALSYRKSEYHGSSSKDRDVESLRRPTISKKQHVKIDANAEQKQLEDILGDDSDGEEDVKSDNEILPVKIIDSNKRKPAVRKKQPFQLIKKSIKIKSEKADDDESVNVSVKIENDETDEYHENGNIILNPSQIKKENDYDSDIESSLSNLLRATPEELFLLQLPDALPGHLADPDDVPTTNNEQTTEKIKKFCTINDLPEGLIGKIIRYKSGKTKLMIGETLFDIDKGIDSEYLQDVASISTNREERSGTIYGLGQVVCKYDITPDWEDLFAKTGT